MIHTYNLKAMRKLFGLILITFSAVQSDAQNGCSPQFSENAFKTEVQKIKIHDFDQAKKEAIELLLTKCLTSIQLKKLLQELNFEQDKLDIAKKAFSKVSDPSNFTIIKSVLDFEESKNIIDSLMKG